jgi:hypothetical protein
MREPMVVGDKPQNLSFVMPGLVLGIRAFLQ